MDLKGLMLSDMSDKDRQILYDSTYMCNFKKPKSEQQRVEWWLPEAGGWGIWEYVV